MSEIDKSVVIRAPSSAEKKKKKAKENTMKWLAERSKKEMPVQLQAAVDFYKGQTVLQWPRTVSEKEAAVLLCASVVGIPKEIGWSGDPPLLTKFVKMLSKHPAYVAEFPSPKKILQDVVDARNDYYMKQRDFREGKELVVKAYKFAEKIRQKRLEVEKTWRPMEEKVEVLNKPLDQKLFMQLKVEVPEDLSLPREPDSDVTMKQVQDALNELYAARDFLGRTLPRLDWFKDIPLDFTDAKGMLKDLRSRLEKVQREVNRGGWPAGSLPASSSGM